MLVNVITHGVLSSLFIIPNLLPRTGIPDAALTSISNPAAFSAPQTSQERELWTFVNMNLAIVYLRMGRQADFLALLDRISPESLPSQSHSLRAASYYVQGLHGFFQRAYNDAK